MIAKIQDLDKPVIICVDDETTILDSLKEQLNRKFSKNYDIELALNGKEVLELCEDLREENIDIALIISDHIMPNMKGDELLIKLHHKYPEILKILLTGQTNSDFITKIVNSTPLYRYLSKPWQEQDLILTVQEALNYYNQKKQIAIQNEKLRQINQELEQSLSILHSILEATADGILVLDNSNKVTHFNTKLLKMWNLNIKYFMSLPKKDKYIYLLDFIKNQVKTYELDEQNLLGNVSIIKPDEIYFLELNDGKFLEFHSQIRQLNGIPIGQVLSFRDVTERRKNELLIKHQACYDFLTDLPNRKLFNNTLLTCLEKAKSQNSKFALMFLDLDHFKNINDTLGHDIGDLLLQNVVKRIKKYLREEDTFSRWGGDEFTLLLPFIKTIKDTDIVASRIIDALKKPFLLNEHNVTITFSIGIVCYPHDGVEANILLKNADMALYKSKNLGRNCYNYFSPRDTYSNSI